MVSEQSSGSLEALRDVGQRHSEGLQRREGVLEVQGVRVAVDAAELHHLFPVVLDLEVLGGLLRDAAAEVELVHLAVLVPHGRLVVHDELPPRAAAAAAARQRAHAGALQLIPKLGLLEALQVPVVLAVDFAVGGAAV